MYKTTKNHFEIFKKECWLWIKSFGIRDFEYYFEHKLWEGSFAHTQTNLEAKNVQFTFSTEFTIPITIKHIKRVAFHEVQEVLFADIRYYLSEHYALWFVNNKIHKIIRILENNVFED